MSVKLDINVSDLAKDITTDVMGKSAEKTALTAEDLSGLLPQEFVDIMNELERDANDFDSTANKALSQFVGVLYMLYRRSEGTNYSFGDISKEALDSIDLLSYVHCGDPYIDDYGYIHAKVYIEYDESLYRKSVQPKKYDGIDNILELLNNGYRTKRMRSIRGKWHGKKIKTLPRRYGAHFFDDVIATFMDEYAKEYHIVDAYCDVH